jgi:hypothetical protein
LPLASQAVSRVLVCHAGTSAEATLSFGSGVTPQQSTNRPSRIERSAKRLFADVGEAASNCFLISRTNLMFFLARNVGLIMAKVCHMVRKCLINALTSQVDFGAGNLTGFPGGLNGWKQHSAQTQLAVKTKDKPLAKVRSAGTLPWLCFDRVRPNG